MAHDYILTYWWNAAGPGGTARPGPIGVAVSRGSVVTTAAQALQRRLVVPPLDVLVDRYEILSAIILSPKGPVIRAVSLQVDGAEEIWNAHVSSEPEDGADLELGSKSPNMYAITGTETEDDLRFVQLLRAADLDEALLAVEGFLDKPGGEQVRFWSAVGMFPDGSSKIWWLGPATRGRTVLTLVEQLEPEVGFDVTQALQAINRHRAQMGQRPLDPAAAGWTDQDVRDEAERLARLPNPLEDLKHRLI